MSYDEDDDTGVLSHGEDDDETRVKTVILDAAALRELVVFTSDDSAEEDWPSEAPTRPWVANDRRPPPSASRVEVLSRRPPALVFPVRLAVAMPVPTQRPAAPRPAPPRPAPPRALEHRWPPFPPRVASARPLVTTVMSKRRREARARVHALGSVRLRLLCLALLGAVVASQPWWWDVGDLNPRAAHAVASQPTPPTAALRSGTPPSR